MTKKIVLFVLITLVITSVSSLCAPHASADWLIDRSGTLIKLDPLVLGDSDEQNSEDNTEEHKQEESKSEEKSSDRGGENKPSEAEKRAIEQRKEIEQKVQEKARERAKEKLESTIKTNEIRANKNRLETESEIEVEDGRLKIKQKTKDAMGKETETQLELGDGEELQVESRRGDIKEKFHLNPGQDGSVEIEHGATRVHSKLPITVNADNELVVTRPDGTQRTLTVLPDQAMLKLRENSLASTDDELPDLEEENGESVYKINAQKEKRVLGLFKVALKTRATLSAETGDLLRTEFSGFDRFLNLFSF